jgi:GT2 family glycosyltransferase
MSKKLTSYTPLLLLLLFPIDCIVIAILVATELFGRLLQRTKLRQQPDLPAPKPECSFVIPSWNSQMMLAESLPRLLEEVAKDGRDHEIIVVDNCSTDGTQEFIQRRFPAVKLVRSDKNLYFAEGNRLGISAATRDVLVLMNCDTIVEPGFLSPLLMPLGDPSVFGVASKISSRGTEYEETGNTHAHFKRCNIHWEHAPLPANKANGSYPVFWLHRGAIAIDRRKYLWLGGLDSLYDPLYMEDVDLSYRAWKVGWKCLLAVSSQVSHNHHLSIPLAGEGFIHLIVRRNQYLFFWKNINSISMLTKNFIGLMATRMRRAYLPHIGVMRELHSFFAALKRLPAVLMRRLALASVFIRSDQNVFHLTREVATDQIALPYQTLPTDPTPENWTI